MIAILTAVARRWRSSRSATSSTSSASGSGSTASTSRSGRCTCSPSAGSRSTGSCSAAGHQAPSTRSSARCAAAAQLISYEVSQGLALVGVMITARNAVAHRDRPRAGGHVVLHPAVRRLPDLHGGRRSPRPTARRSTCVEADAELVGGLLHRVRRHARSSPTCSPST